MGFLNGLLHKDQSVVHTDDEIVAVVTGKMIPAAEIEDEIFSQEMMGQSVGFLPADGRIVSPANGTLEMLYPTGHAFAVRMKDGSGLLVHIGIDTVNLKGNGFKTLKKQGDSIKAGEAIVDVDLSIVRSAGLAPVTILILSEPISEDTKIKFIEYTDVKQGQKINQ